MRTIDADALEDKAKRYSLGYYEEDQWAVPLEAIDEAPTIDAVSVVRCKDCKNREKYPCGEIEFYECSHLRLYGTKVGVEDDWFCADGERKESE